MTSNFAVAFAAILQVLLRITVFIQQRYDHCSPAPELSSWIFLLAFLILLKDIRLYPVWYMNVPLYFQLFVETMAAILLTELATVIIWCSIERLLCLMVKVLLIWLGLPEEAYYKFEKIILGVCTCLLAISILSCITQATDVSATFRLRWGCIYEAVIGKVYSVTNFCQKAKAFILNFKPIDNVPSIEEQFAQLYGVQNAQQVNSRRGNRQNYPRYSLGNNSPPRREYNTRYRYEYDERPRSTSRGRSRRRTYS